MNIKLRIVKISTLYTKPRSEKMLMRPSLQANIVYRAAQQQETACNGDRCGKLQTTAKLDSHRQWRQGCLCTVICDQLCLMLIVANLSVAAVASIRLCYVTLACQ